ncbi:hypothetical protein PIB30_100309, partial [Stylosanthes scabra]|nr:hypothetical protein [Stylosanthes scabra]
MTLNLERDELARQGRRIIPLIIMGTSGERRQLAGADRSKTVLYRGDSELGVLVVAQLPRSGCGSHQRTERGDGLR